MSRKKLDDELLMDDDLTAAFLEEGVFGMPSDIAADDDPVAAKDGVDIGQTVPGQLAVDVFETKEKLVVKGRVAGVNKSDLDVSLSDNTLSITGTLSASSDENVENYFGQECYWGEFSRIIALPVPVKEEGIEASLKEGVLTISLVKVKSDAVKKIQVQ